MFFLVHFSVARGFYGSSERYSPQIVHITQKYVYYLSFGDTVDFGHNS